MYQTAKTFQVIRYWAGKPRCWPTNSLFLLAICLFDIAVRSRINLGVILFYKLNPPIVRVDSQTFSPHANVCCRAVEKKKQPKKKPPGFFFKKPT